MSGINAATILKLFHFTLYIKCYTNEV